MAIDVVNDLPRRVQYTATAAQTFFDYTYPIFTDSDLVVDVDGVTQALDTDYTVAGETEDAGGTITFVTPMTGGEIVTIYSELTIERTTDFQQNGPLASASFNDELDRLIIICQELRDKTNRSIRLPATTQAVAADTEISPVATWADKYLAFDSDGVPTPAVLTSGTLTQAILAALYDPVTAAETSAGVTPNTIYPSLPYDVRRAGLVPNSTGARAANTAALKVLLSADEDGPKGWIVFPNTTGADTYYFNMDDVPIREGVLLDCQGCTLDVAGSYSASNDTHGFLEIIRGVRIDNFFLNINYDGSLGTNNGIGIRVGSRIGYGFGTTYSAGVEDEDLSVPMGNCAITNGRITSNNPSGAMILMLGGLEGVRCENLALNGSALVPSGIYYEFGFYHYEATVANRESSHANNLYFSNIKIDNMKATTPSVAFSLVGCMSAIVDGLTIDGGYNGVTHRCGEALYYNKGAPNVDQRAHIGMRNVVITDTASTALTFTGAESKSSGYLSGEAGVTEALQCDLISFSLQTFSIEGTMTLSGRSVELANGIQYGGGASGGILLQDECVFFDINNVHIKDNAGIGLRFQSGTNIFSVARFKRGTVRNCLIAGSTGVGTNPANSKGVIFDACRFGYETIFDGVDESTQTSGVSNSSTATDTLIRNCYGGTTSAAAVMYINAGSGGWKRCMIESASGLKTLSGQWTVDGHGVDADIGDANTTLDPGVDLPEQRYATTLTGNRTVTLGTGFQGAQFRVIRTGLGAFTLDVGGLKTIASGTAAFVDVVHDGTSWRLAAYGAL